MTDPKRPEDADATGAADFDAEDVARAEAEAEDAVEADFDDEATDRSESEFVNAATPVDRPTTPMSSRDRAAAARAAAKLPPTAGTDELPYVDDRVSKIWVGAIAGTFLLIMLYGLFLGENGFLVPAPTPVPSITPAPSLSISPAPSATPGPSGTPGASASPGASSSASPAVPTVGPSTTASPASPGPT